MKKLFTTIVLFFIFSFMLFAGNGNSQRIYSVESEEYKELATLYISSGFALPSTTGPWSEDELRIMFEKINPSILEGKTLSKYNKLKETFYPEENKSVFRFAFKNEVSLEFYAHTNTNGKGVNVKSGGNTCIEKAFQDDRFLSYNFLNQKPFFSSDAEMLVTDHFYALFEFFLKNNRHVDDYEEMEMGYKNIQNNIFLFRDFSFNGSLIEMQFPERAFLSFGGKYWNVQLGRDRLSWGNGKTGNFAISDNMPYQTFLKFSLYSGKYKYSLLTSFYPHPINYWNANGWNGIKPNESAMKGLRMYIAHRLEGRFFNDKLSLSLTDGLMYMSEDNTIYFDVFNPLHFNHNNFIPKNSNSTLIFEIDYTPIKGLNIYGQFIMDEFVSPIGEEKASPESSAKPSALGYLLGIQSVLSLKSGLLSLSLEGVYTDPYLYLRFGCNGTNDKNYGVDYIVALRRWHSSGHGLDFDEYTLGYTYGGDAIVGNLNAKYELNVLPFVLEGNVFFMAHGTHDKWTGWSEIGGSKENYEANKSTPTTSHTTNNNKYPDYKDRNKVQYSTILSLKGEYSFDKHWSTLLKLDFVTISNYKNIECDAQNDFQVTLSGSFKF